ncbi:MAG TPA: 8-oxo-dGTP diphosphatase [Dehalococcoidia bacterium]|nr:8-oxo-dGTP diphosphatase [Dehalococcoidia bacterium]
MARFTPVLATLGYVLSPDGASVLMIHRDRRQDDVHLGKYNGLGGKVEADEDVAAAMRRELREEAGIEADELTLRGTLSWPGFGKGGEDWFGFVFRIDRWHGEPLSENAEGRLEWVPIAGMQALNLWEGDRLWLDYVFQREAPAFHGVMPYKDGVIQSWSVNFVSR